MTMFQEGCAPGSFFTDDLWMLSALLAASRCAVNPPWTRKLDSGLLIVLVNNKVGRA